MFYFKLCSMFSFFLFCFVFIYFYCFLVIFCIFWLSGSYYLWFTFMILQISDIRERQYEKMGIGSSYLFRLDDGYVVSEATMRSFPL